MSHRIIESTEDLQRIESAEIASTTFFNYIKAWVISFGRDYGDDVYGQEAFVERIKQDSNYIRIRRNVAMNTDLRNAFIRGKLTLRAINALPIDVHEDLARIAILWLPVQSYYSIHGIGLATILALNMHYNNTHASFLGQISQVMRDYMPTPFCAYCNGGPVIREYTFTHLCCSAEEVCDLIPLRNPQHCEEIEHFIGKSLSTTRTEFLERRFADTKKHLKRKRFSMVEKLKYCSNEPPTSVIHLLYRLRLRSNYDNPDMFLYADSNEVALERYANFKFLTNTIITGLETLMEKAIGSTEMIRLRDDTA